MHNGNLLILAIVAAMACSAELATAVEMPVAAVKNRPRLAAQIGHSDWVYALAFSADGRLLLTGSEDYTARLWDVATGLELMQLPDQGGPVKSVAISPDNQWLLTIGSAVRLWDSSTGKMAREFPGQVAAFLPDQRGVLVGKNTQALLYDIGTGRCVHTYQDVGTEITALAVSSDGKQAAAGNGTAKTGNRREVVVWRLADGERINTLIAHTESVSQVAFSPDGSFVLSASSGDSTMRLWNMATGKEVRQFSATYINVNCLASFADNGRAVLTWSDHAPPDKEQHAAVLWDTATGKEIRRFGFSADDALMALAISPDGRTVATGHQGKKAILWDAIAGKPIRQLEGQISSVLNVARSADSRWLLICRADGSADLWDLATGRPVQKLAALAGAFSTDGKAILLQRADKSAELRERETGKVLGTFTGTHAVLSPDGKRVATFDANSAQIVLWDAQTGRRANALSVNDVQHILFAPDSLRLMAVQLNVGLSVWDAATGQLIHQLTVGNPSAANVSASGRLLAIAGQNPEPAQRVVDYAVQLRHVDSAQKIRWLAVHQSPIYALDFSSDASKLFTAGNDKVACVWDVATGKRIAEMKGHLDWIKTGGYLLGDSIICTGSHDGTVRLWNAGTGQELCQLINFQDGTWAVVDEEGRFDAANGGQTGGLHWVVGLEAIELAQLKERYYDPGLVAKKLQFNREPLREVAAFAAPPLHPQIEAVFLTPNDSRLRVTLTNRGGGIGRVVVKVNGKEREADARPRGADPAAPQLAIDMNLAGDPRLKSGEKNEVEIVAYNAEGYLASRGLRAVYQAPGAVTPNPPQLWGILAGVSDYRGENLDLRFAAKDADDFASALQVASGRLFGPDRVHLTRLTTNSEEPRARPTRANLVAALTAAREAKPEDILVVYLAGHGMNYGGQDGDFYFLAGDAQTANLADPQLRAEIALSSQDLTELVKQIPALKQVLILDTCASGRLIEKFSAKRDVPTSQIRALERMKDRTGFYVLAGCAADAVSYEASRYGQGMLTYSLLQGMRGAKLREGEFVDVLDLFSYAADTVPELAKDIGGIQRPVIASPSGGSSFDIGQVTRDDQTKIPLAQVRPLILQSSFQEAEQFEDVLQMGAAVDRVLRNIAARGSAAPLVFVEARDLPAAYRLVGRYTLAADKVQVVINLFRHSQRVRQFALTGNRQNLDALAQQVVTAAQKEVSIYEAVNPSP